MPCATVTSGGNRFLDGDTDTCINIQQEGGATLEYKLNVNENCLAANHVSLKITVPMETNCYLLQSIFVAEDVGSCGGQGFRVKGCEMIGSAVQELNKICSLSCKCTDLADSCEIQMYSYSRVIPFEVQICEIGIAN